MKAFTEKIVKWYENQSKNQVAIKSAITCAVLLVLLCISIIMHVNIQRQYAKASEKMTEQIFQKLVYMEELFSYVDAENIDVEHKLIPQLKGQYTAAIELNKAITDNYGAKYSVLSEDQIAEFDAAFSEYASAFAAGISTNLARDDMAIILAEVQDMINARYNPTPVPTTSPVIIDGSAN